MYRRNNNATDTEDEMVIIWFSFFFFSLSTVCCVWKEGWGTLFFHLFFFWFISHLLFLFSPWKLFVGRGDCFLDFSTFSVLTCPHKSIDLLICPPFLLPFLVEWQNGPSVLHYLLSSPFPFSIFHFLFLFLFLFLFWNNNGGGIFWLQRITQNTVWLGPFLCFIIYLSGKSASKVKFHVLYIIHNVWALMRFMEIERHEIRSSID